MTEAQIQAQIVETLRLLGFYVHSIPNEAMGKRSSDAGFSRVHKLRRMGVVTGAADLAVWYAPGRVGYMEVKTKYGKQTQAQEQFEEDCRTFGIPYDVVRTVEEAQMTVLAWRAVYGQ